MTRTRRNLAVRATTVALAAAGAVSLIAGGATGLPAASAAATRSRDTVPYPFVETWATQVPGVIAQSSPMVAVLDGTRAVVVGARNGQVYGLGLRHGQELPGWPVTVPGAQPVDSTASVAGGIVHLGVGNAAVPTGGGYLALNGNGSVRWFRQFAALPGSRTVAGVQASMAIGRINGVVSAVAGSLGQYAIALHATSGAVMPGFPFYSSDSSFSTPAIARLYGGTRNYIVAGADQTAGNAFEHQYAQGGHIRVIRPTGNAGTGQVGGGVVCDYTPNQTVDSSPAVGRFLARGAMGIVVGTGTYFPGATDTDKLIAIGTHCGRAWEASLDGATTDSPALVDALGNGGLQVAEGTSTGPNTGSVYLLNGAHGTVDWATNVGGQVIGSITSADLGGGHQDLLVPTTGGLYILNGRNGGLVAVLGAGTLALQSSPLVTDDPDGLIGITIAGYNADGGLVVHYEVARTNGRLADTVGAWPMFHHDPQLTGFAPR